MLLRRGQTAGKRFWRGVRGAATQRTRPFPRGSSGIAGADVCGKINYRFQCLIFH